MFDPRLLLGESIFTSFRVGTGEIPRLDLHIKRLYDGVNQFYFSSVLNESEFEEYFQIASKLKDIKYEDNQYFRLTIYSKERSEFLPKSFELEDLFLDISTELREIKNRELKLKIMESPFSDFACDIKAGSYFQNLFAKKQAMNLGHDDVLFCRSNKITELSTSNIIFYKNRKMFVPISPGMLKGITLVRVLEFCLKNSIEVVEKEIYLDDLNSFSAAFALNSVSWINRIVSIDEINFKSETDKVFFDQVKEFLNE